MVTEPARTIIIDRIRNKLNPLFVNTVWGHIIYRPIKRARWRIPYGMKTLEEFMRFHEKRMKTMMRRDHPIALEIYLSITLDREMDKSEVGIVSSFLSEELVNEFFAPILDFMEWGHDVVQVEEVEPLVSKKRWSRDGEEWEEEDITRKMERVEDRFR